MAYLFYVVRSPYIDSCEDLKYLLGEGDTEVAGKTVEVATKLYKEQDLFDVQVLAPMNAGDAGIDEINRIIQEAINSNSKGVRVGHYELREGDKIIATKNDSGKDISNGDVGVILRIEGNSLAVRFQGEEREVSFTREEWGVLQLSYAVTVHRAQGSEYKFCVIPLAQGYRQMLQKNLFYTAITRAKKKLWIVFDEPALSRSVQRESVPKRNTSIKWLLQQSQKKAS